MSTALPEILAVPTPKKWLAAAREHTDVLLIDHAHCEKKAASSALALIFRYGDKPALVQRLSRLAREELRHFEQVLQLMDRRGIPLRHLEPSRYAPSLRRLVRQDEPRRRLDLLLVAALIEARSCERFELLAPHLDEELGRFYATLYRAEARHCSVYLEFARAFDEAEVARRLQQLAAVEAELITAPDPEFRFHSGSPAEGV